MKRDHDEYQEWIDHGEKRARQRARAHANRLTKATGIEHWVSERHVSMPYLGSTTFLDVVRKGFWIFGRIVASYDSVEGVKVA